MGDVGAWHSHFGVQEIMMKVFFFKSGSSCYYLIRLSVVIVCRTCHLLEVLLKHWSLILYLLFLTLINLFLRVVAPTLPPIQLHSQELSSVFLRICPLKSIWLCPAGNCRKPEFFLHNYSFRPTWRLFSITMTFVIAIEIINWARVTFVKGNRNVIFFIV